MVIGKSLFKKYRERRKESQNQKLPGAVSVLKGKGPKVSMVLWPTSRKMNPVEIECEIDTGCGFLLSLPIEMSEGMNGFDRCPEYDRHALMPNGNEVEHLAFRAIITISGINVECICHWAVGTDQPLLGLPLFLSHLKLEVSKDGIEISPTR